MWVRSVCVRARRVQQKLPRMSDLAENRALPSQDTPPAEETHERAATLSYRLSDASSILPPLPLPDAETEAEYVHKWSISNFKELRASKRVYSDEFVFLGSKWRILLFPNGNNSDSLAVFLDSIDAAAQPKDSIWHVCLQFAIAAVNPSDETVFKHNAANHRYNPTEVDWGFNHLCKLKCLHEAVDGLSKPLVHEENHLTIQVFMRAIKDETGILWHNFMNYDSKKTTGFLGLKNQGATCYMNSLLQSLYFINYFRSAVFNIPTDNEEPTKSIPLALQRIFYQLQFSEQSVGTTELTKSFGWDTLDSFMQHDVQEFNRVLQDNLESKMKGTKAEGAISKLFVGKYKSYIKCINVDYESSRIEDFYDIQLNVKGFKTLRDSFADYIAVETMDGDNKYQAEGHGLQDARKGVVFTEFPPVLHLQLKRFEYDFETDAMVKINDRYEFPNEIDLAPFLDKDSTQKGPQKYILHGVLVHAGDVAGGHYQAFLRAEKLGKWFKFDDDRVTPVSEKDAMEENYGVDPGNPKTKLIKRFTNAYMLVYVRDSTADEILKPITKQDIPEHLRRRFDEEKILNEQKRKDREEQHLFFNVQYITDDDIVKHSGFDLCNLDDKSLALSTVPSLRVKKDEKFSDFKKLVADALRLPNTDTVKVWNMVYRENKTLRVHMEILGDEKTLEEIKLEFKLGDMRFYVDTTGLQNPGEDHSLIFLKNYDPVSAKISFVTKLFVDHSHRIADVLPKLAGLAKVAGSNAKLYEEVRPGIVNAVDATNTFADAGLGSGDILCIQNELSPAEIDKLGDKRFSSVVYYFEDYRNRLPVIFKHKNKEKEAVIDDLELVLSKRMTYEEVVAKLGPAVKWPASRIQLLCFAGPSVKQPIKRSPTLTLTEMTSTGFVIPNAGVTTLYYELLAVDLSVYETQKVIRVTPVDSQGHESDTLEIGVFKTGRAADLWPVLKTKFVHAKGGSGQLRLFEALNFKYTKIVSDTEFVSAISDNASLYVEEVPVEESTLKDGDKVISVAHFNKEIVRGHGVPFRFVLFRGEPFSATRSRLIAKLGILDKDVPKTKFFLIQGQKPKPLEDDDILSDVETHVGDYLGIDHVDRSGKAARNGGERAIKIFN
ncbi:cysteine proteinase [Chytriomyces sp. MP71]|nr:cysteine proteinase [Chytriomyces sp. MP71]